MAIKRDPTSIGLSFDEQQFHRIYDCAGSTILGTDKRAPTKGMDSPVQCNMFLYQYHSPLKPHYIGCLWKASLLFVIDVKTFRYLSSLLNTNSDDDHLA